MNNGTLVTISGDKNLKMIQRKKTFKRINRNKWLYLLLLPGCLYYLIFKFLPMWGILIAFQDFSPYLGFFNSPWVGIKNFSAFFINPDFGRLLKNTLLLSFYNIVFFFPMPILLALLLNEIRNTFFKKTVQTLIYVPHFISWIIVASITYVLCGTETGVINQVLFKLVGHNIEFLSSESWFRPLIIIQSVWKDVGWGTIIFLAALAGVDTEMYEAAVVDGANRFKQMLHITLPSIKPTIILLLILRMGSVLDNGFDQIFVMTNALNQSVATVFDTYVYSIGITQGAFSYSTAVGLFKSIVGLILILSTNYIAKKSGEGGLF